MYHATKKLFDPWFQWVINYNNYQAICYGYYLCAYALRLPVNICLVNYNIKVKINQVGWSLKMDRNRICLGILLWLCIMAMFVYTMLMCEMCCSLVLWHMISVI